MNASLPRPARKVPILLYTDDIAYYRKIFGHGWSGHLRDLLAADVRKRKQGLVALNPQEPRQ